LRRWWFKLVCDIVVHIEALIRNNSMHSLIQLWQVIASVQQDILILLVVRLLTITAFVTLVCILIPVIEVVWRHFFI
jgi:hypothetical protein